MTPDAFEAWLSSDELAAQTLRMALCDHMDAKAIRAALRCLWSSAQLFGATEMGKEVLRKSVMGSFEIGAVK